MTHVQLFAANDILIAAATVSVALVLGFVPSRLVAQQPQSAAPNQGSAQNAPDRLPGKIYVQAVYERRGENAEIEKNNSVIAIDPNTGDFKDIGDIGHSVRVSPDGQRYAASQRGSPVNGENGSDVYVIDATLFETQHIIENAGSPAWSGDGNRLVYNVGKIGDDVGWRGKASIIDLTTKKTRELPIPETDEVDDWSAAGDWLVTVSDRHPPFGSGYQLYAMHSDGSDERRLTEGRGLNCYPRFRPGTNQIVYHHQASGVDSLWLVDIDGKNRQELMKSKEGRGAPNGACWSPDGKWLAVAKFDWSIDANGKASLGDPALANYRLEIIAPDGALRGVLDLAGVTKIIWLGHADWR
jgi:Tol biopolymer transport system component